MWQSSHSFINIVCSWAGLAECIHCHVFHFISGLSFGTHEKHHAAVQAVTCDCSFLINFLGSPYLCQTVGEREADISRLQEQLVEANQAVEASRASQAAQGSQPVPASNANSASDAAANQALQEELAKLRQEVLDMFYSCMLWNSGASI